MKKQNKFLWIYLTGIFLILALPLLNLPPWFSPPDWGKTIIFRVVMTIMILVFIWQILSEKKLSIKTNSVFWLLIALLIIFLLATIFSLDRTFSLWGSPYRSGGFINFAFLIIFTLLFSNILRKSDWPKVWIFSLIIGVPVSIIGIIQAFEIFPKVFVTTGEPWSTIGGSSFLAMYLLMLSFIALYSTVQSIKNLNRKWFFYLPCLLLFIFVITLTGSRAAYLGLILGLFYFVFAYPKKLPKIKKGLIVLLILVITTIIYSNTQSSFPDFVEENKILREIKNRTSISLFLNDPRFSVWRIGFKAMTARPILGYGPENFSIAFDKYYDPSLPRMMTNDTTLKIYYDRAHNFLLDAGIHTGIFGLIIYVWLFATIFLKLQKNKKEHPEQSLIYHGIQSALMVYIIANFFAFDTFPTYLLSFLLIAYSLFLISEFQAEKITDLKTKWILNKALIIPVFILLALFVWEYNIKPFNINTQLNKTINLNEKGLCQESLEQMEQISKSETYLDDYISASYGNAINLCVQLNPRATGELIPKGIEVVEKTLEKRPTFTRYWILLQAYYNMLLENYQTAYPEYAEDWIAKAEQAFEKAKELSPKRQEAYVGIANTYLVIGEYEKGKEKAWQCINLNPKLADCWRVMALLNINLNELEEAKKNIEKAIENDYLFNLEDSLLQFRKAYYAIGNEEEVCNISYKLAEINETVVEYYLDSMACHVNNGELEEAKKVAIYITTRWPKYLESINEYLIKSGLDPIR